MQRVVIIGGPGSGKTTLGEQLAVSMACAFVELDALFWGSNWTAATPDAFRAGVSCALQGPRWVAAGNYSAVRDLLWGQADTLVWLDYSFPLAFGRLLRRTFLRIVRREELWAGNRETWRNALFSRNSLLWYMPRTHLSRRHHFFRSLNDPRYRHVQVHRFTRPAQTRRWLDRMTAPGG